MKNKANEFTILDWIGWGYVIINLPSLFYMPRIASTFQDMYESFGSALPKLTALILQPWFPITLGIIAVGIFSLQLHGSVKNSLKRRRAVVVISFFWATVGNMLCVIGLYKPIFEMASAVN